MRFQPRRRLLACASTLALAAHVVAPAAQAATSGANDGLTETPIKHVVIIVGENRTFDHLFATYVPPSGSALNLLSQGIVNADGTPGANFAQATQYRASEMARYSIHPKHKTPYTVLPPPLAGGGATASDTSPPPFATVAAAAAVDTGLLPEDVALLTTGATGLTGGGVDTRISHATQLPSGPFQLSPGASYDAYAASPVHRFYQMWQETDCSAATATASNPSGCLMDLFPWVETSVGAGSNGKPQASNFSDLTTREGSTAMGFYNVQQGDVPYFKSLADQFALADNYHQPVMGGTGANSIMLGYADAIWFSDGHGSPLTPPANQVENPTPQPGTNNFYTQDGYSGGSYTDCSDPSQSGALSVEHYLHSLATPVRPNCEAGHYYLLNNYNPGYLGNGVVDDPATDPFSIPPSNVRTIADVLNEHKVSWTYYGEGWTQYVANPDDPTNVYCNICNPFQYSTQVMTDAQQRANNLKDTTDFAADAANGTLPAVSYVKPGGLNDGHPASSKFDIFEAFTKKILAELQSNPEQWASTAVFVTVDEGGGYYDSGLIQPLDFFGDGTRIPLLVVSPYAKGVGVVHSYADHVSMLKFVERNWGLPHISGRSRDNLPAPIAAAANPYAVANGAALDDLMDFFKF